MDINPYLYMFIGLLAPNALGFLIFLEDFPILDAIMIQSLIFLILYILGIFMFKWLQGDFDKKIS